MMKPGLSRGSAIILVFGGTIPKGSVETSVEVSSHTMSSSAKSGTAATVFALKGSRVEVEPEPLPLVGLRVRRAAADAFFPGSCWSCGVFRCSGRVLGTACGV